jgi:hypothetical protein
MTASEDGQSKGSLRDEEVVSVKDYSRPPSIVKLVRFRLRMKGKAMITWAICQLSALWDRL